jgi:DNA-binding LacI/PurR family transcriptional regulator/biotin operon repressor
MDFTLLSPSAQVAAYLREELMRGRWTGTMPGGPALAKELGVDGKTVWSALGQLEKEGLLIAQGPGKRRKIADLKDMDTPALRVAILDYEPLEQSEDWTFSMQKTLLSQGHSAYFTEKSLSELGNDVRRVARQVKQTPADAWIVCSGSRDVLEWFSKQETPAFAMFGRRRRLPIAGVGPDHVSAGCDAVQRLIDLGHKRIVMVSRESQLAGGLGSTESAILDLMKSRGLPASPYNLPNWEDNAEGLHRMLEELFRFTPPTALFIDEPFIFHAVKDHLAQRGIVAPSHVSLICSDPDHTFSWSKPTIAHIRWDHGPVVRRVVQWVNNIAKGKNDLRQTLTKAEFVEGGTVGRVPQSR